MNRTLCKDNLLTLPAKSALTNSLKVSFARMVCQLLPCVPSTPLAHASLPEQSSQPLLRKRWRKNLETTRDFTYVEDTVDGFLLAAEARDVEGQTFNLGTGVEIKIGDLAKKIIQQIGSTAKIRIDTNRLRPQASEVFRLISNNTLAREKLDWQPKHSLDDGLRKTIGWIRSHLEMYDVGKYEF